MKQRFGRARVLASLLDGALGGVVLGAMCFWLYHEPALTAVLNAAAVFVIIALLRTVTRSARSTPGVNA